METFETIGLKVIQTLRQALQVSANLQLKQVKTAYRLSQELQTIARPLSIHVQDDLSDLTQDLLEMIKKQRSLKQLPDLINGYVTVVEMGLLAVSSDQIAIEDLDLDHPDEMQAIIKNYLRQTYGPDYQYTIIRSSVGYELVDGMDEPQMFLRVVHIANDDSQFKDLDAKIAQL